MHAIIETGGKQYRVSEGQVLKIETLPVAEGETVIFDKVLMVSDGATSKIGTPYLGTKINAVVLSHGRHRKIHILKFRRRKHHMKRMGHRQNYTEVRIESIAK